MSNSGQPAVTHFESLGYDSRHDVTLCRLQLETGRTHQIRVHLASIGHPLSGDTLYGGSEGLFPRQALHAIEINVTHPITKERVTVTAPLPDDLKDEIGRLFGTID